MHRTSLHPSWLLVLAASFLLSSNASATPAPSSSITLPVGTKITAALTRPVWANTVAPGELLYTQTLSAVTIGNQVAIPAGTYVEATVKAVVKPTSTSNQALFQVQFDQVIFANGYVITLSGTGAAQPPQLAYVTVKVTPANDLLMDNGAQITLTLKNAITLDASMVTEAIPLSQAPDPASFHPATLCRTIPGSPGSDAVPDTVIPGSPGSPGTPDTVIPGIDGGPDTVIPGIPPTPPTPPTTLFGTGQPATPPSDPIYCPAPPLVLSSVSNNPLNQTSTTATATPKHHKKKQ